VTVEEGDGGDSQTAERRLDDADELLYRQVHPQWIVDGEPSSQAFKPTRKDEGMLSIALGHKTTAEDAFLHHTQALKLGGFKRSSQRSIERSCDGREEKAAVGSG
jgi:hypothetical protein